MIQIIPGLWIGDLKDAESPVNVEIVLNVSANKLKKSSTVTYIDLPIKKKFD